MSHCSDCAPEYTECWNDATKCRKRPGSFAAPIGSANTPLRAEVKDGKLVVEIGIETLEWASKPENGGPLEGCKVDGRRRREWAEDVEREMTRENEIGKAHWLDSSMK